MYVRNSSPDYLIWNSRVIFYHLRGSREIGCREIFAVFSVAHGVWEFLDLCNDLVTGATT